MKKVIKNINLFMAFLLATVFFVSCSETDYMEYDISRNGVYFKNDTIRYSYGVTPIEIKSYTLEVPVYVMGGISEEERVVACQVINEGTDAISGEQYNLGEAIIYPDSVKGFIPVEILRDGLDGTYAEGYTRYNLKLRLVQNQNFIPTLSAKEQEIVLIFDNAIEKPEWYSAHGDKVWLESELGVWHPLKLIKMVEYFHAYKDVNLETYKKMVELYGENLEHIPYGSPYVYRTIFKKYIYDPMYKFFNDPANKDMILKEYPDFPFDFPDPFGQK